MLDRSTFLRPIAHRGLHAIADGIVENTWSAFQRAIDHGYAIECDLQAAAGGVPLVFHDFEFARLVDHPGPVREVAAGALATLVHRGTTQPLLTFAEFLARVGGRVPLYVEIKSAWTSPLDLPFLQEIAQLALRYDGPLALMSFDPRPMAAMRDLAPRIPRGLVSGLYVENGWWKDELDAAYADRLSHLLEAGPVEPAFISYHAGSLPTPVTRYVREVQGLPVITWTIRSADEMRTASRWSDAPTFEGFLA